MEKITVRQVCFFFIAFLPVIKIFTLPSILASISQNDLWISILINALLDCLTLVFILRIIKDNPNKSFFDILSTNVGKKFAVVIYFLYGVYFTLKAFIPITEQKIYVERTIYENTYSFLTFIPFFVVSIFACTQKKLMVARLSDICVFITTTSFILMFILALSNLNLTDILPIGISKTAPLKASYYSLPWFGDSIYLLFIIEKIHLKNKDVKTVLFSYGIAIFMVLIFTVFFYAVFSSIATRQIYALTEISKYSQIISMVGRLDFVAIFGILFCSIIAMILPIYFASNCFNKAFNLKNKYVFSFIINGIIFFAVVILSRYYIGIQVFIQKYLGVIYIIFSNVLPLLSLISLRRKNEKFA